MLRHHINHVDLIRGLAAAATTPARERRATERWQHAGGGVGSSGRSGRRRWLVAERVDRVVRVEVDEGRGVRRAQAVTGEDLRGGSTDPEGLDP